MSRPSISPHDIEAAFARIESYTRRTPTLALDTGAFGSKGRIGLKLELLQHAGSFKPRGAFNRMLASPPSNERVIAASGGNFAVAVAYAARVLGHTAEIFVPEVASPAKVARLHDLGAEVNVIPGFYADALRASEERAKGVAALVMHAYDQFEIVAGQGTVGLELDRQMPDLDTVLVAVGGGGLIGGIASWFAGRVRVIGVEPRLCPTMNEALAVGRPIEVDVGGLAADSLGAGIAGHWGFEAVSNFVDQVVLVEDGDIRNAQRTLWNETRIVAEPGGAASLAALLSGAYRPLEGEYVAVLVCGGNTDPSTVTADR
ncbi:MAG: threonine/serine dehydratase [Actinomycetota bacterium]